MNSTAIIFGSGSKVH